MVSISDRIQVEEQVFDSGDLALWAKLKIKTIRKTLFDRQQEAFDDDNLYVLCHCGRRAGKTKTVLSKILAVALGIEGPVADVYCLYMSTSIKKAMDDVWRPLKELARTLKLHAKVMSSGVMILPNGVAVLLTGCATERELDIARGKKFAFVAIDETQSWKPFVKEMVVQVIGPALTDLRGHMWMVGTPGEVRAGFFFDAIHDESNRWSKYSWTMWENPFIQDPMAIVREQCELFKTDIESPEIQREWFNNWVEDVTNKAYKYSDEKNGVSQEEIERLVGTHDFKWILGVDQGYADSDAFVALGYDPNSPLIVVRECHKKSGNDLFDTVASVKDYMSRYKFQHIVVDEGGGGKKDGETMRTRFGLPTESAKKKDPMNNPYVKKTARNWLNGELKSGNLKIWRDSPLAQEWRELLLGPGGKELDKYENHLADAALYAYRRAYYYREPKPKAHVPHPHDPNFMSDYYPAILEKQLRAREMAQRPKSLMDPANDRTKRRPF